MSCETASMFLVKCAMRHEVADEPHKYLYFYCYLLNPAYVSDATPKKLLNELM